MSGSLSLRYFALVVIKCLTLNGRVHFESIVVLPSLLSLLALLLSGFVLFLGLNHVLILFVESVFGKYACPRLVERAEI